MSGSAQKELALLSKNIVFLCSYMSMSGRLSVSLSVSVCLSVSLWLMTEHIKFNTNMHTSIYTYTHTDLFTINRYLYIYRLFEPTTPSLPDFCECHISNSSKIAT